MRTLINLISLSLCVYFTVISQDIHSQNNSSDYTLGEMEWRQVGPFRGGRSCTATGVPGNDNLYYFGSVGGGVWKTNDAGNTWKNISDGYFGGSIGAIAVSESDPNIIYVGTGEQTLRGNVSNGFGIWKSTDAGNTWKFIGLKNSEHISRIRIHPTNPDIVYVGAIGSLWKPNETRGLYKSMDGGKSWKKTLYINDKAGIADVALDPNNPRILYASTWNITRNGYRMDSGGPDCHLWKSTDSGETWDKLTDNPGMPKGVLGIIGIAVSHVNSNRLYSIIENEDNGGVYKSDDAGKTWKHVNKSRGLQQRAWYYNRIYADTQDEDIVYVMNVRYYKSKDGGAKFDEYNAPHGDHHDLWIDPNNNQRMIIADDGGAQVSNDAGENWSTYHNQPTSQFYRVTTDNSFPFRILGAQQDNSTVRIDHRSSGGGITERNWEPSAGGESAHLAPDPLNPNIVYGGTYKGYMMKKNHETGQNQSVNIWPFNPAGSGVEVMKYRFNWNYPLFFSQHDKKKLYAFSNHVHETTNGGKNWKVISPDLTRAKPETLYSSGGSITQDNTGVEFYATIFAAAESHHEQGVMWTGSDDGLIHLTKDGGKNWVNVTPPKSISPEHNMINSIDIHPFIKGGAYVAATSYKFGDYRPYLYKTENYGKTWTKITSGIDAVHYTRVLRADKARKGLLYAGTEWGMYVSYDDGKRWEKFQMNLPIVAIRDLHIKDNTLIAATHGRSFWMIDDLAPVQQLTSQISSKKLHLYKPKDSYRLAQGSRYNAKLEGENHPNGVLFNFFVKDFDAKNKLSLEIKDGNNQTVKKFSSKAKKGKRKIKVKEGGNRFIWNMRGDGFVEFPGMVLYSSPNNGPKVVPGSYKAIISYNGQSSEQEFNILKDPRLTDTSIQDLKEQYNFLIKVRNRVSDAHKAMLKIGRLKKDLKYVKGKISDKKEEKLENEIDSFKKKLEEIENKIHMTKNKSFQDPLNYGIKVNNRLAFLMQDSQRGDHAPTDQSKQVYDQLSGELGGYLSELDNFLNRNLNPLKQGISRAGVQLISLDEASVSSEINP